MQRELTPPLLRMRAGKPHGADGTSWQWRWNLSHISQVRETGPESWHPFRALSTQGHGCEGRDVKPPKGAPIILPLLAPSLPPHPLSLAPSPHFSPSRLLQDPASQLRTTNHSFVEAISKYFNRLIARVVPLQVKTDDRFLLCYLCFRTAAVLAHCEQNSRTRTEADRPAV